MGQLKEGDQAPGFEARDQSGTIITLDGMKGKKVILYFYPKDDTPGCTKEACNFRDNYSTLKEKGFEIIGVSPDNDASHQKFTEKYNLPFRLIPDPDKQILNAYGAFGEKNMYGKKSMGVLRSTFVIDEEGKIEKIFKKVDTSSHTEQILTALSK